jgi:hypothetical protein
MSDNNRKYKRKKRKLKKKIKPNYKIGTKFDNRCKKNFAFNGKIFYCSSCHNNGISYCDGNIFSHVCESDYHNPELQCYIGDEKGTSYIKAVIGKDVKLYSNYESKMSNLSVDQFNKFNGNVLIRNGCLIINNKI